MTLTPAKLAEYKKAVVAFLGLLATVLAAVFPTSHTVQLIVGAIGTVLTTLGVAAATNADPESDLAEFE